MPDQQSSRATARLVALGGLAAMLVIGTYYGYSTPRRIAFLESGYSDETQHEARRRQFKVATIVALLVLSFRQTLQRLTGG